MAPRVTNVLLIPAAILACLAPLAVQASVLAPPRSEPAADELAPEDPAVTEAQELFLEGASKFETADYAAAIELWTKAYGIVPSVPEYALIKAKLIANLASAQERAYAVDHQPAHLNQAKILLESYQTAIDDIYPTAVEREHELAWVTDRLDEIDAELQVIADREAAERAAAANETEPDPPPPPGRVMIISGSVLSGLGVVGLGVMIGGMAVGGSNNAIDDIPSIDFEARAARFAQGRVGNKLAIIGGIGGAALLGAGAALLVLGIKQKRAAGQDAPTKAALVPILDPTLAGLGLVGRF